MNLTPFQGGRKLAVTAGALGLLGLALTAVGGAVSGAQQALYSYLVAFVYWLGVALGGLVLLGAFHASNARWPVVLRRFLESAVQVLPLFVVLFVPIALGMQQIFPWTDHHRYTGHAAHLLHHKAPYLNTTGFLVRAAVYFGFWIVVAHLLRAWSIRQDHEGGVALTARSRKLGAVMLPFLALTLTFAAFDWMMSLDPLFFSTIFGVYWFAGSFMATFAVTILAANATRADPTQFGAYLNTEHFHSLGKFMLAFTAFWAYVAFSQFMLIWIANVPEEVPWYIVRIQGGWRWMAIFLVVFHFVIPFFTLLQRAVTRTPSRLALVAVYLLAVHWVDLHWLLMPNLHPAGPRPSPWDFTAFVGVGGLTVAFAVFRMRGVAAVPVRDPYLDDSLRYLPQ